jgi:hypothetical protein
MLAAGCNNDGGEPPLVPPPDLINLINGCYGLTSSGNTIEVIISGSDAVLRVDSIEKDRQSLSGSSITLTSGTISVTVHI